MFAWARDAAANDVGPLPPVTPLDAGAWVVDTGDPARDRLLAACVEVIADVGFERATASRITRRAGLGTHWVYLEHDSKQALLVDAVELAVSTFVATAAVADLSAGSVQTTPMGASALAMEAFLHPARRAGRLARVEIGRAHV